MSTVERAEGMQGSPRDERPPIWSGHIAAPAGDLAASAAFYTSLGMRPVFSSEEISVLELRGGTHLILQPRPDAVAGPLAFDLMVEDLPATHAAWVAAGHAVTAIRHGRIHDSFTVTDPFGNTIVVNDSHVIATV